MSKIVWKQALRPPDGEARCHRYEFYDGDLCVPRTTIFADSNEQLVQLPDARAYRALSRAGLLLVAVALRGREVLAQCIREDAFRIGIYCAIEQGPNDFNCAKQMINTPSGEFAASYKALRSPKQYFKQLPNVPASQLAIFMEVTGPQVVYQHSRYGCLHALDQAEFDLSTGLVCQALVCSAFSLEDPLLSIRTWQSLSRPMTICEGAAAIVLQSDGQYKDWSSAIPPSTDRFYGMAQDLMMLAEENYDNDGRQATIRNRGEGYPNCFELFGSDVSPNHDTDR